jgi:hypothetical protein
MSDQNIKLLLLRYLHLLRAAATMLLIGQEIDRQRQSTPRQHRHEPLVAEGAHQTIEGHRRDMVDDGTELETEPPWVANSTSRATSGRI